MFPLQKIIEQLHFPAVPTLESAFPWTKVPGLGHLIFLVPSGAVHCMSVPQGMQVLQVLWHYCNRWPVGKKFSSVGIQNRGDTSTIVSDHLMVVSGCLAAGPGSCDVPDSLWLFCMRKFSSGFFIATVPNHARLGGRYVPAGFVP